MRRLQKSLNLRTVYPRPRFNTSEPHPEHEKFPHLLRKCKIERPNQVWSTDITYTAVAGHRAFVIGIVDWFSRKVLAYNVVNTMDAFHCVETLKMAVDSYGKPEIFNSDQGNQFTSSEFVAELRAHGIQISMDGRGRCLDNDGIHFVAISPFEKISPRSTITMELAGHLQSCSEMLTNTLNFLIICDHISD